MTSYLVKLSKKNINIAKFSVYYKTKEFYHSSTSLVKLISIKVSYFFLTLVINKLNRERRSKEVS